MSPSKTNVLGYMLFSPLFFASIGIKTNLEGLTGTLVLFAVALTVVAILSKIIGCGLGARLMGFQTYDAFSIGLGMISRGEVALIVAQKGAPGGPDRREHVPGDRAGGHCHDADHPHPAQIRHEARDPGEYRIFRAGCAGHAQTRAALRHADQKNTGRSRPPVGMGVRLPLCVCGKQGRKVSFAALLDGLRQVCYT